MDYWTLIGKIRDAVKSASGITSWCTTNYGQQHKVYIGYDEKNLPDQDDYPIIVISPTGQHAALDDYGEFGVEIGYGLVDAAEGTSGNVITYQGVQNLLEFRKTVETVLFDADTDLGGSWVAELDELIEPVELFPVFVSLVLYTFKNPDRDDPIIQR